jgi:putative ABC transport system permease protein
LVGIALQQLRRDRARTVFAVVGVAFAVLTVTLLVGVGVGVLSTGEELLDESGRDLWVTGGPIEVQPSAVGGFQNPIVDAHTLSRALETHDQVSAAVPMSFQVVYVSADGEEFDKVLGAGVPGVGSAISLEAGSGFSTGDRHYAGGGYDGTMTHEVVVDPGTAAAYNLSVGETLHVGGTTSNAKANAFTVVGISPTFRKFLGGRTVTVHLSELQTLTGTAYADRATLLTLSLADGVDAAAVKRELSAAHPGLTIRTNREQFRALLERQALVITGGVSLAVLGVLAGMVLSVNLFLSLLYAQRRDITVVRAIGGSRWSVLWLAVVQAAVVAVLGGVVGLAVTPVAAGSLDGIAASVTGFEGLVQVPSVGYLLGGAVAASFGLVGAVGGVLRVSGGEAVAVLAG